MKLLKFSEFINENNIKPAGIEEPNDGSDKDLEKKLSDEAGEQSERCPRCNELFDDCSCSEDDYWSTQTFHRSPKGKVETSKPKQQFKQ